jgi:hypothetical protein
MRYTDAAAFRQALEARLRTRSGSDGSLVARNRKRVAFDRLLARLVLVAPQRWRLKGGFALELRFGERARATKDVDINWHGDADELLDVIIDVADHDVADFFTFAIERSPTPPDRLGGSHRFTVTASLAGRMFESFVLDVAISPTDAAAETLVTHDLLAFADIPAVRVHAIPLETQIAEKVHAYTRRYGGDRPSSRAKDLVDLVLVAELEPVDAAAIRVAIDTTFNTRATHVPPESLPEPPAEWTGQYRRLADQVGVSPDLDGGHALAAALLDPVLVGTMRHGIWNPKTGAWTAE